MSGREHRGTIFVEDAELLAQQEFPGRQFVIRLRAPKCAAAATPGSFAHLTCDPHAADAPAAVDPCAWIATAGWVEILYKIVGPGLEALSKQPMGSRISVLGPIGQGFTAVAGAPAHAARGRRRRHPADGVPRRVAQGVARDANVAAAGADGLGDSVPVPRAPVDHPACRACPTA